MKLPIDIKDISEFSYLTTRKLKKENGEKSGEVVIWQKKGEEEFNYKLICPYCGEEQESHIIFKKRPYRLKCSACGSSIVIEKLASK
jgi:transcription elongation factor Elf1